MLDIFNTSLLSAQQLNIDACSLHKRQLYTFNRIKVQTHLLRLQPLKIWPQIAGHHEWHLFQPFLQRFLIPLTLHEFIVKKFCLLKLFLGALIFDLLQVRFLDLICDDHGDADLFTTLLVE